MKIKWLSEICCVFFFYFTGCAAENKQITISEAIPVVSASSMEKIEAAFEILDESLARYYFLTDIFSKKLEYSPRKAEMEILDKCFQGIKSCFQRKWEEIYANPENAVKKAEELLPIILEATENLKKRLEALEMEIKSARQWARLPSPHPTP